VTYSGTVLLSSEDVRVASGSLEAKLDKDGMVENATASGAVRISHQNGRECKGDRARWSLDTGTFVVEGNPAEIRDPVRGRSAAPRLTYFKANDTILLGNP
jgi:lipopolysaccharide assembly outer membrane protein LptD (OstA)